MKIYNKPIIKKIIARTILIISCVYSFSLVSQLTYLLIKNQGDLAGLRFLVMGFAKPFILASLLIAFKLANPVAKKIKWSKWFSLIPLCLVSVELIHAWNMPNSWSQAWELFKAVMYVKYINTAISLSLIFCMFEIALVTGFLDKKFYQNLIIICVLSQLTAYTIKLIGTPPIFPEIYKTCAWSNAQAFESTLCLIILMTHRKIIKLKIIYYFLLSFLGTSAIVFSSRGNILLNLSLFSIYICWLKYNKEFSFRKETLITAALLGLNIAALYIHVSYYYKYSNLSSGYSDLSSEVLSVNSRIKTNFAALDIFKKYPIFGVGAAQAYRIQIYNIGTHSLWALLLAGGGLTATVPAVLILSKFLFKSFQRSNKICMAMSITAVLFGLNLINQFPWWYSLALIQCIPHLNQRKTKIPCLCIARF